MKRPDGITVIAAVFFLIGAASSIGALTIILVPFPMALTTGESIVGPAAAVGFAFIITAAMGVFAIVAGFGLLQLRDWARWIAIGVAVLLLFGVPIGTLIGGLLLWYLFQEHVKQAFASR